MPRAARRVSVILNGRSIHEVMNRKIKEKRG